MAGHLIHAAWDTHRVTFCDTDGVVLIEHDWPPTGITYVSTHPASDTTNRGGRPRKNTHTPQVSPKS